MNMKEAQHLWWEFERMTKWRGELFANFIQGAGLDHSTCFSYYLLFRSNLFHSFLFLHYFGSFKFINIWEVSKSLIHFLKIWLKTWRDIFCSSLIYVMNNTKSVYLEIRLAFAKARWFYVCSKLTIKTPERCQWRRFSLFIVILEHISHLFLMFTVDFEQLFTCWNWTNNVQLQGKLSKVEVCVTKARCPH